MIDEKKNTPAKQPADETANAKGTDAPVVKQQMSRGEKWYNKLVYQGLNYWLNLGISLVVTDFFMHGKGKQFFHDGVDKIANKLTAVGLKRPTAKWFAEIGLGTFSLNSGGNLLLIPTKYLEDYKRPIVHWLNDKLGVDQTAPDGHKETAKEIYIEQEQPAQSWGRMIWRRFLGWGATTAVGMTLDKALARKLDVPKIVDGEVKTHKPGQQFFTEKTVEGASYVLNNFIPGGKKVAENDAVKRYMGYAALDSIYTIITSKILHLTNGAGKKKMPDEIGEDDVKKPAPPAKAAEEAKPAEQPQETAAPEAKNIASDIIRNKKKDGSFVGAIADRKMDPSFHVGA